MTVQQQPAKATKENLSKILPQIFGEHKFTVRASKETLAISWVDGVCIDRVIRLLIKSKIEWRNLKFQRTIDKNVMSNFLNGTEEEYKQTVADFYPKYKEQLEDEAQLISLMVKGKFFDFERMKSFATNIEINQLIEDNRIYMEEPIVMSSASHQNIIYKIEDGIKRAITRFFETDEVKKQQEYLQMKHELSTKQEPEKKPVNKM